MARIQRAGLALALAVAVMAAACGDDQAATTTTEPAATTAPTTTVAETTTTAPATTTAAPDGDVVVIEITGFIFSPAEVTVPVGTTVEWVNLDQTAHTTTAADGSWNATLNHTETFWHVMEEPGEFPYVCTIHMGMAGVVIVEG
jgi:plastocyanin